MEVRLKSTGKIIRLDTHSPLGSGGEAHVYGIPSDKTLAAKIYHDATVERVKKLTVMLANPPADPMKAQGHTSIAWPVDLLTAPANSGKVLGYVMARLPKMPKVFEFYGPAKRLDACPLFDYRYLHHTARNIASAMEAIHARGYVVGDVNESNILVSDTALIAFIDTDSFQVKDPASGQTLRCIVGKPEYTPPELKGKRLSSVDRSMSHDHFGLATLIFLLLMEGTHPFDGVYTGSGEPPKVHARIAAGYFPHGHRSVPFQPKPVAPPFAILHPGLQQLFIRCFEEGHATPDRRPSAQEWQTALDLAIRDLQTCAMNAHHLYDKHLGKCPWCTRKRNLGYDPFPSKRQAGINRVSSLPSQIGLPPAGTLPRSSGMPLRNPVLQQFQRAPHSTIHVRKPTSTARKLDLTWWAVGLLLVALAVPSLRFFASLAAISCGLFTGTQSIIFSRILTAAGGLLLISTLFSGTTARSQKTADSYPAYRLALPSGSTAKMSTKPPQIGSSSAVRRQPESSQHNSGEQNHQAGNAIPTFQRAVNTHTSSITALPANRHSPRSSSVINRGADKASFTPNENKEPDLRKHSKLGGNAEPLPSSESDADLRGNSSLHNKEDRTNSEPSAVGAEEQPRLRKKSSLGGDD